jgi:hypothetical protein
MYLAAPERSGAQANGERPEMGLGVVFDQTLPSNTFFHISIFEIDENGNHGRFISGQKYTVEGPRE